MSSTIALNQWLESAFQERNTVLAELRVAAERFLKRRPSQQSPRDPTRERHSPTGPADVIGLFNPHGYRPTFDDIEPTLEHILSLAHEQRRPVVLLVENNGGTQPVMKELFEQLPFEQLEAVVMSQDGPYWKTLRELFDVLEGTDEELTSSSEVHESVGEHNLEWRRKHAQEELRSDFRRAGPKNTHGKTHRRKNRTAKQLDSRAASVYLLLTRHNLVERQL